MKRSIAVIMFLLHSLLVVGQDTLSKLNGNEENIRAAANTLYSKGLKTTARDSSYSIKFGFRFQNLVVFESTTQDYNDISSRAMVRRARLKFDGFAFSPNFSYKLELGLTNSDIGGPVAEGSNASNIVLDAVGKYKILKNTSLWFGQTKLPGNRERVISSQSMQFVDRSELNAKYNIDRDMGIQLHHEFSLGSMIVRDIYSVSMGEGRNITAQNRGGYDYTARIEVLPFGKFENGGDYFNSDLAREETPKLSVAVTYDYNDDAVKERGQLGRFLESPSDLSTIFADLMFKYRGFSIMGEYADKKGSQPFSYDEDQKVGTFILGKGLNLQGGYLFHNNWEIAARYTEIQPAEEINRPSEYMYTFGISKYFVGHNLKFQSDFSLLNQEQVEEHELMARFQFEFAF